MRSFRTLALTALGLSGLGASMGCAIVEGEETTTAETAQAIGCPEDVCGSNSPKIEVQGFHELNLAGRPNAEQMRLLSATLHAQRVSLEVENGRLYVGTGRRRVTGQNLVGLRITLEAVVKDQRRKYLLEIEEARELPYPVGAKGATGAYVVKYTDSDGHRQNLCGYRPGGGNPDLPSLPWDEGFGQKPTEALFFEGDRIDTGAMTVGGYEREWFNIGCAGHALAKLHLTRHTTPSDAIAHGHSLDQRQATLKMFVADYCGDGTPFTVPGQPLTWHDAQGVVPFFAAPTTIEARWKSTGATCLGEPRLMYPATEEGRTKFPQGIHAAIQAACPQLLTQPCLPSAPYDFQGQALVSANRLF